MMSGNTKIAYRQRKNAQEQPPAKPRLSVRKSLTPEERSGLGSGASTSQQADDQQAAEVLKAFDLTGKYGPCTGMRRIERWERAEKLGLKPPPEVKRILAELPPDHPLQSNIWAGRV